MKTLQQNQNIEAFETLRSEAQSAMYAARERARRSTATLAAAASEDKPLAVEGTTPAAVIASAANDLEKARLAQQRVEVISAILSEIENEDNQ